MGIETSQMSIFQDVNILVIHLKWHPCAAAKIDYTVATIPGMQVQPQEPVF